MRAAEVALTSEQRATLRSWLAAGKTERRLAFRAQIILAVAEGLSNKAAAGRLATRAATVSKWRGRFGRNGFAGEAGGPPTGDTQHVRGHVGRGGSARSGRPPPGRKAHGGAAQRGH